MRRYAQGAAAAAIAAAISSPAWSQEAAGYGVEEVVVTARKRAESLQDVPLAITALSGEALRQQSARDITDIQNKTPSLFFADGQTDQSAVLITIRGQGQPNNFLTTGPSVGVYVDGVYIPRQIGLKSVLSDIDRIEVLKGPQGTLYGRNTTGGAININSVRPEATRISGFAESTAGAYGQLAGAAAINLPLVADRLAVRVSGLFDTHRGYGRDGMGVDLKDGDSQFVRASLLWTPSDRFEVLLTADWQHLDQNGNIAKLTYVAPGGTAALAAGIASGNPAGGFAALSAFTTGSAYRSGGTAPVGSKYDGGGAGLTATWDLGGAELKTILGYRTFDRESSHDYDASPFSILQGYTTTKDDFYSAETNLSGEAVSGRLDWVLGAYYSHEKGTEPSYTTALPMLNPINPQILDGTAKDESYAVYGQSTFALAPKVKLTTGLRWSEEKRTSQSRSRSINSLLPPTAPPICNIAANQLDAPGVCQATRARTFSDYNYLASLDYRPSPELLVYAKTSRGFRSGGQNGASSNVSAGFVPYEPEVATDYELGFKADLFERRLRIDGAAYYTDYKDIQRSVTVTTPGGVLTTLIQNAAKAAIKGAELQVEAHPVQGLSLNAVVGYTDAQYDRFMDNGVDRSNEPFSTPKWTYSLGGRYGAPVGPGELAVQADWSWRSRVVYEPQAKQVASVSQAGYGLLNGRISYSFEEEGIEIAVFGRNLLDKTYRASALSLEALGMNIAYTGDPRTWGVQVRKRF